ncbi:hypothetical protein [Arthrobacter sp. UYCo732]|uniref:lipopolysaccharide biosynthesis protein n=1 Tax=Arthrobacter sp. UYCo732 TaxID=3156336 RepID=UPI003393CF36
MSTLLRKSREFDLGGLALTRLCTLAAGLGANVFVIAVLARQHGPETYAAFALIASLVNLLPFADLGLGASIVNATADRTSGSITEAAFKRQVSRARDYMLIVMVLLLPVIIWAYAEGYLSSALGNLAGESGIVVGAAFTLFCIALSIPLGIGARALQGCGRMIDVVRLGFIGPGVQILTYVILFVLDSPAYLYFLGPGTAYILNALVGYLVARRTSPLRTEWPFVSLFRRGNGGDSPWQTALPFLLISVGMAAGFQSHRLLLTQYGNSQEVAEYSVAAQFLGPLIAITSVVGQNLWSRYRGQIHRNELEISAFKTHILIFAIIGAIFVVGYVSLMPLAAWLLTGNSVAPPITLLLGAGAYLLVYAIHQPSAMLLTDPRALWYQAAFVVAVAVATIMATVSSVPYLGSAAPYVCMAASMMLIQVLPSMRLAVSRIARQSAA